MDGRPSRIGVARNGLSSKALLLNYGKEEVKGLHWCLPAARAPALRRAREKGGPVFLGNQETAVAVERQKPCRVSEKLGVPVYTVDFGNKKVKPEVLRRPGLGRLKHRAGDVRVI